MKKSRIYGKLEFPFKYKSTLYLITAGAGVAAMAYGSSSSSDGLSAIVRSSRAISTIGSNVVDYKYSLRGLSSDSDDNYIRIQSEVCYLCLGNL